MRKIKIPLGVALVEREYVVLGDGIRGHLPTGIMK